MEKKKRLFQESTIRGLYSPLNGAAGSSRIANPGWVPRDEIPQRNEGVYAVFFRGHFHKLVRVFRIILSGKISKVREARRKYS